MPSTPLSGVRISCEKEARKVSRAFSMALCAVKSCAMQNRLEICPP
jgi:hypothetical protein